jgi:hypothetical protein
MKRIFLILTSLVFLFSCQDDEVKKSVADDPKPATVSSQSGSLDKEITENNSADNFTVEWQKADYGVSTAITYEVQIDSAGLNFAHAIALGTTNSTTFSISLGDLNDKLLKNLKVTANVESTIELRVKSSINGETEKFSPVVTFKIKTWQAVEPPAPVTLWVPGDFQGWSPGTAPVIRAVNDTLFEGFVYINAPSGFKFTSSPDWDHINYGPGANQGELTADGTAGNLGAGEAGYYRFRVDVTHLKYQAYDVKSFGLIGTATAGGWNTSTPMTYDEANNVWKVTADLNSGALKFRANDAWDVNYGPANINDLVGKLIETNDAISISEPGNYTITLDFSKSVAPYDYNYKVVKNSNAPPPTTLWVPGDYQSWSPSTAPVIYSVAASQFEGYVFIKQASGFKFTSSPDWDHVNYGAGATDGDLITDGNAGNLGVDQSGYYRFKVDIDKLKYEHYRVESFGVIGTATPGGWDNSTVMTYDETSGLWTITMDLVVGALKFRANNSWDVNYGPADSNALAGDLMSTDASISIPANGNYTITMDMTKSGDGHKYVYNVVKN